MAATPGEPKWARLHADVNHGLRRGAWYRVIRLTEDDVVLEVNRAPLRVPRPLLDLVTSLPRRWSVVSRLRDAVKPPPEWGDQYAACPVCRNRARIKGRPLTMRCHRCDGVFRIAWEELGVKGIVARRHDDTFQET